ncbi:hypothetical protein DL93DRAFT_1882106 [Clavulina sp. PMI_390]|nr:hypothetical protein DL93DRAFT_1882106 [Clavulina sp. PMI_390]
MDCMCRDTAPLTLVLWLQNDTPASIPLPNGRPRRGSGSSLSSIWSSFRGTLSNNNQSSTPSGSSNISQLPPRSTRGGSRTVSQSSAASSEMGGRSESVHSFHSRVSG